MSLVGMLFVVLLTFFVMLVAMADFSGDSDRPDDSIEDMPSIEEEFEPAG